MVDILDQNNNRLVALPIENKIFYDLYLKAKQSFWDVDEIDFSKDRQGYEKLNINEKHFIKYILAFFSYGDALVNNNINMNFINEIQVYEIKMFLNFQAMIEDIHSITYSLQLYTVINNDYERKQVINTVLNDPILNKKKLWIEKYMNNQIDFNKRIIAFTIMEGLFFSASFCAIYYFKDRKKNILPGLSQSNELIARDEGLHTQHSILIYKSLQNKLKQQEIETMFKEAVNIESEFITKALPCSLIGMNSDMMKKYIQYVADRLLYDLGYKAIYEVKNPFTFMENISLQNKTNFFESRTTEYARAEINNFEINDDF